MNYCPRCGAPKEAHKRDVKLAEGPMGLSRTVLLECPVYDTEDEEHVRTDWDKVRETLAAR